MVKKLQALKAKKGFTLVELIVVIAIIGVLAAILVPVMMGQVQKAKQTSLDSTAGTVLTAINTWIADRYTRGVSGDVDGTYVYTSADITGTSYKAGLNVPSAYSTKTDQWGVNATGDTGLKFAIEDAYNLGKNDVLMFWIDDGKCVAAAYGQGNITSVGYSDKTWSGVTETSAKDGLVEVTSGGVMVGTNPKATTANGATAKS